MFEAYLEHLRPKNVVEVKKIGNTTIYISDDYVVGPEETEKILKNVSRILTESHLTQMRKKQKESEAV